MPEWLRGLVVKYRTSQSWDMNSNRNGVSSDRKSLLCHCSVLMFRDSLVAWVQLLAHEVTLQNAPSKLAEADPFLLFVTCCYIAISKDIHSNLCQDSESVWLSSQAPHCTDWWREDIWNHWFNNSICNCSSCKFPCLNYINHTAPSFYSLQRQCLVAGRVRVKLSLGRVAHTGSWFLCKKGFLCKKTMLSWSWLLCQATASPRSFKVWSDLALMESWIVQSLEWTQKRLLFC